MPRRAADEEEWEEDDEEPTISCPHCRAEVHEDAQRCPHCENYISEDDYPPSRKPWWLIVGVLLCLYAVYRWIAG
jgi:uncharacterized paraquat-inducible protein A